MYVSSVKWNGRHSCLKRASNERFENIWLNLNIFKNTLRVNKGSVDKTPLKKGVYKATIFQAALSIMGDTTFADSNVF